MIHVALALAIQVLHPAPDSAQDALIVAADEYTLEFENAAVRIVRARGAHPPKRTAMHNHSGLPVVHIALRVVNTRHYLEDGRTVMSAREAGSVIFGPGRQERHAVENLAGHPTDNVRVELKTPPTTERASQPPVLAPHCRLEIENEYVRVVRVRYAPAQRVGACSTALGPGVVVLLTALAGQLEVPSAPSRTLQSPGGEAFWVASLGGALDHRGAVTGEALLIEPLGRVRP